LQAQNIKVKKYWDHKTKPSTYVIEVDDKELFRGNYADGMMFIKSLDNDGMISFWDDYLPEMKRVSKITYRALHVEKELRREIIKLKKELKSLTNK